MHHYSFLTMNLNNVENPYIFKLYTTQTFKLLKILSQSKHLLTSLKVRKLKFERTFGILEFSQKPNVPIRFYCYDKFVCLFFGRIRGHPKSFRNYLILRKKSEFVMIFRFEATRLVSSSCGVRIRFRCFICHFR